MSTQPTDPKFRPPTVEEMRPFCYHAIPEEKPFCLRPNLVDPFVFVYDDGWITAATNGKIIAFGEGKARWARELSGTETEKDENLLKACYLYYARLLKWAGRPTNPTPALPVPVYAVDRDEDSIPYTFSESREIRFLGQPVNPDLVRKVERCAGPVQWMRGWEMERSSIRPKSRSPHYYIWKGPRLSGLLCPLRD